LLVFVCAGVLIGVKHILASMRRPLVAFAWCVLGGILGGALSWFLAWSFVPIHPVPSHGEDYGAMAAGMLNAILLLLSPIAGFLTGFPVALAICALFQSKGTGPKPSVKQSDRQ
jgi:biotin transporter BioY